MSAPTYPRFSDLQGKTIVAIDGCQKGSESIRITTADLMRYSLFHSQDCCEHVRVEDVTGGPEDLIGQVVMLAEESTNDDELPRPGDFNESFTWTFYKLRTHGGDLTIRWLGESNGYYSESVDVEAVPVNLFDLTPAQQVLCDMAQERGK